MSITSRPFGNLPDGTGVNLYTLTNKNGLKAEILNYGGIVVSLYVPDKDGNLADVVLGYNKLEDYLDRSPFFGALIGRNSNRMEGASFNLNGIKYNLNKNEGNNQLHGGIIGYDKKMWDAKILSDDNEALELSLFSPDMDENYPGNLEVRVIYRLSDENALEINYYAASDKDTIVNLTNHTYFNISGHDSGTILNQELSIDADFYTPINSELLPTGEIYSVKGTPFDFTQLKRIGEGLSDSYENEQMKFGNGYDHNFVLRTPAGSSPREIAKVYDSKSGRLMTVLTTKPAVQFYSGNGLKGAGLGKDGILYDKWHGLCLETQFYPNSMKYSHFTSPVLKAQQTYHHATIYKFSTR
ncbi:MAG: galactose mutarotase [Clostridiaceae bacterium]|jgi:aldose 1-epimerase|nr:galactose mutarotase [Clostridiaceae bacterium]